MADHMTSRKVSDGTVDRRSNFISESMSSRTGSRYVSPVDPSMLVPGIIARLEQSLLTASPRLVDRQTPAEISYSSLESHSTKKNKSGHGRSSPCHDLGYHTLVTPRQDLPPTPVSMLRGCPSPWSDSTSVNSPSPFTTPTPGWELPDMKSCQLNSSNLDNTAEQILTSYKGKRLPRSSYFDRLTDQLILKIFSFLSTNQLCVCARACRRWYFLAWEPQLWTTITLTGEKINADRALKTLVRILCRHTNSMCLTVEKVVLNGCTKLTNKGVMVIAKKCPELRFLEARACAKITDEGIHEIVTNCLNLQKLDISGKSLHLLLLIKIVDGVI